MVTASIHSLSFLASIHQKSVSGTKDLHYSNRNVRWRRRVGECVPDPDHIGSVRPSKSNPTSVYASPGFPRWLSQVERSRGSNRIHCEETSLSNSFEDCGCGARSELPSFQGKGSKATRVGSRKDGSNGSLGKERKRRKTMSSDADGQTKMLRPALGETSRSSAVRNFQSSSSAESENEENALKDLATRIRSTLVQGTASFLSPLAKWTSIAGAVTAAGLSFTICSSAVADTMATVDAAPVEVAETTLISEGLRSHMETKTEQELWTYLKVHRDGVEEITPLLRQCAIDDKDRQTSKDTGRARLDSRGKVNSLPKVDTQKGQVVPAFYPSAAPLAKETVFSSDIARSSGSVDNRIDSTGTGTSLTGNLTARPAPEQVVAGTRTVRPVTSVSALPISASVPGVSLLTRLIMHFSGGGVAGAIGATLVYPLDTIKTRMQAQNDKSKEKGCYENEWDCFLQMVTKEGPGSLYSGLLPQLVGIAPEKAMKLTVNDVLMEMLESELPGVRDWALELVAGGGGGFCQVVFTNPMEIVKVRLQTQSKDAKQKNTWDIIKELGVQGLYNGSIITIIRDVPSTAIFFAMYSLMRQFYPDQSFWAGFVAAIPATVLVTPFDVVKTRMQMEQNGQEVAENAYCCFMNIVRNEGVGALFKGSRARVLKTSPQFGLTLMLYNILSSTSPLDIAMGFVAQHMNILEATTKLNFFH